MELRSAATEVDSKVESGYLQLKLFGNTKEVLNVLFCVCESAIMTFTAVLWPTSAASIVVNTTRTETKTCSLHNLNSLSCASELYCV